MKSPSIPCALGKLQASTTDYARIKRDAWVDEGILVVDVNSPNLNWAEKQMVRLLGEAEHGRSTRK